MEQIVRIKKMHDKISDGVNVSPLLWREQGVVFVHLPARYDIIHDMERETHTHLLAHLFSLSLPLSLPLSLST